MRYLTACPKGYGLLLSIIDSLATRTCNSFCSPYSIDLRLIFPVHVVNLDLDEAFGLKRSSILLIPAIF